MSGWWCFSGSLAVSASVSRPSSRLRISRRRRRPGSVDASARCSSWRSFLASSFRWRWMFLLMAVPAIMYGLLAFTIPESPRYLVATYRIPEARKVLSMLLGEKNLEITITRIQETLKAEKPPSWRDLRKPTGGFYGIVWVGVGLSVFQQFVGINVIFYYSNVLWEAVGFKESSSFTITVITSIVNILTTLIAIALIDKVGRKPLLLIGSTGMAITLATMAIIFQSAQLIDGKPHLGDVAGPIALVAANLFVVAFGMSWGP